MLKIVNIFKILHLIIKKTNILPLNIHFNLINFKKSYQYSTLFEMLDKNHAYLIIKNIKLTKKWMIEIEKLSFSYPVD